MSLKPLSGFLGEAIGKMLRERSERYKALPMEAKERVSEFITLAGQKPDGELRALEYIDNIQNEIIKRITIEFLQETGFLQKPSGKKPKED